MNVRVSVKVDARLAARRILARLAMSDEPEEVLLKAVQEEIESSARISRVRIVTVRPSSAQGGGQMLAIGAA